MRTLPIVRCVDCGKVLKGCTSRTKRCPDCKKKRDRMLRRIREADEAERLRELPAKDAPRAQAFKFGDEDTVLHETRRKRVFDGYTCSVKFRGTGFYAG